MTNQCGTRHPAAAMNGRWHPGVHTEVDRSYVNECYAEDADARSQADGDDDAPVDDEGGEE